LAGAALVGSKREDLMGLTVLPLEPIPPGRLRRIVVDLNATEREARSIYILNLWAGEAGTGG
jgi:hypothetical protein